MSPTQQNKFLSVDETAKKVHEAWRTERDRGYSPFNKPWSELSPEDRFSVSRQVRQCFEAVRAAGNPSVFFIDEYAVPGPGDLRWHDPQSVLERCFVGVAEFHGPRKQETKPQ